MLQKDITVSMAISDQYGAKAPIGILSNILDQHLTFALIYSYPNILFQISMTVRCLR